MTKSEKESIIQKCEDLGFKSFGFGYIYHLPLGLGNSLYIEEGDLELGIVMEDQFVSVRVIESPEDLQLLFDAICPEKYRLPFD